MVEIRVPYCSVCQSRYTEEDRVPLLLQCGHGFHRDCLSRMFAASTDISLPCLWCRTTSLVGNYVHALRKNYILVGLIDDNSNSNFDDENNDDGKKNDVDENGDEDLRPKQTSSTSL